MILPKFPKNCMKLREFWTMGHWGCPLDLPLPWICTCPMWIDLTQRGVPAWKKTHEIKENLAWEGVGMPLTMVDLRGCQGCRPPEGLNSFNFMQFLGTNWPKKNVFQYYVYCPHVTIWGFPDIDAPEQRPPWTENPLDRNPLDKLPGQTP